MAEVHETFVLWRMRASVGGVVRQVQCSVDHLGDGFFELHLKSGHELLLNEPFQDTGELLSRADELRSRTRAHGPADAPNRPVTSRGRGGEE